MWSMLQGIKEFLDHAGYAKSTRRLYEFYLMSFANWLREEGKTPQDFTAEDLRKFLDAHHWSGEARYSAACALRSYLRASWGADHPALQLKIKRRKPHPQRALTAAQMLQLLASINTGRASGVRNLALVTLLLDTGFRAAEVCRLELRELDLERNAAWTIVKGGEWGLGAFCEYTASCLAAWLPIREQIAKPGVKQVFVGVETHVGKGLTPDGLRSVFRSLGKRAGLGLLSPHDLRRTFATLALEAGAPTRVVQVAGRWESLDMVERYSRTLTAFTAVRYSPVMAVMGLGERRR